MKKPPQWDADFESRLRAADVVLVTNMGVGLDSPFLERLERWLYAHHPKYWIDVVEPKKTDIYIAIWMRINGFFLKATAEPVGS